jgi:transcriptional regulator
VARAGPSTPLVSAEICEGLSAESEKRFVLTPSVGGMYVPRHFAMADEDVQALLDNHGASELITYTPAVGLTATLMPFVHEGGSLHGHVARNNDQWRHAPAGEAMVILRGPDAYISPAWYAAKREHGRVVPTWNYVTAHVYGELLVHDDATYTRRVVEMLTAKHEAGRDHPWAVADAPEEFVQGQLRAIVGVELRITRIEAKSKLSQNRSEADVDGVIEGLGDSPMGAAVASLRARTEAGTAPGR